MLTQGRTQPNQVSTHLPSSHATELKANEKEYTFLRECAQHFRNYNQTEPGYEHTLIQI